MNSGNLFAELKRRNVYKVAVAYAVVAWLLIQAASILFPTYEAPAWVMKIFVAIVVLEFPVALVISWAFEITPEGINRESELGPNDTRTRRTGRKLIGITTAVALAAGGMLAFQLLRPRFMTEHQDRGLSEIVAQNLFDRIYSDPRWLPFLRKLGKAPEQLAQIKFKVTLPP
ncbi:MAG: adenylate cyclase [Verrucomicrobiota bacterium]|jgi:hypothetical protein